MTQGARTIIPHIPRFRAYRKANPDWGSLYLAMQERAYHDECVGFCRDLAVSREDAEGAALCDVLLGLSQKQRLTLAQLMTKPVQRWSVLAERRRRKA